MRSAPHREARRRGLAPRPTRARGALASRRRRRCIGTSDRVKVAVVGDPAVASRASPRHPSGRSAGCVPEADRAGTSRSAVDESTAGSRSSLACLSARSACSRARRVPGRSQEDEPRRDPRAEGRVAARHRKRLFEMRHRSPDRSVNPTRSPRATAVASLAVRAARRPPLHRARAGARHGRHQLAGVTMPARGDDACVRPPCPAASIGRRPRTARRRHRTLRAMRPARLPPQLATPWTRLRRSRSAPGGARAPPCPSRLRRGAGEAAGVARPTQFHTPRTRVDHG